MNKNLGRVLLLVFATGGANVVAKPTDSGSGDHHYEHYDGRPPMSGTGNHGGGDHHDDHYRGGYGGDYEYEYHGGGDHDHVWTSGKPKQEWKLDPKNKYHRLARAWAHKYGLTKSELEEQAISTEEAHTRKAQDEVPDRWKDYRYRFVEVPKTGSKRKAIIMRSNQPSPENLIELVAAAKEHGIKAEEIAVVNLRLENNLEAEYVREAKDSNTGDIRSIHELNMVHVPVIDHSVPMMRQVLQILQVAADPKNKIVVIHCAAGKSRTGLMTACIRIALDGWSLDRAMEEAVDRGMTRPIQVQFLKYFAKEWKAGNIKIPDTKVTT